ncbi:MFS transporter [Prolixibacter sp. NT017]|uniref:MFS transporter n=1 Tax=Prolixibacter sp. NT017 TaxID=2652390 RepID=UPI001271DD96|nr:MFS transporter [Prolixibacter sp. NT017]GET25048.1 MFS transporter [Prolixibacter sp. NT017]
MEEATDKEQLDGKLLFPLVLGTMMNPLNSTMLATALTTICHQFSRDVSAGAYLITPLYVAATIGQPLMGRLADIYNPKIINRLGFILVFIAALIGALAPSFAWLIVSRVILGFGTSAAYPSAIAIVSHRYQSQQRAVPGRVLGIISVANQVSMVLGPILGGFLTDWLGWQGIFLINIPWVLNALYFSRKIPSIEKKDSRSVPLLKKIDASGVALMAVFLISAMFVLTQRPLNLAYPITAVVALVWLIWHESRQRNPFLDVKLLWNQPSLFWVYVRTTATTYILYLSLYAMPQWVEAVKMMSPSQTGLIMFPMSVMSGVTAIYISRSTKYLRMNLVGIISMGLAWAGLFYLHEAVPVWILVGVIMLTGVAAGVNGIVNQAMISVEVPQAKTGVSFGLYRTFGYFGAIISGTQIKSVFRDGVTDKSLHLLSIFALASFLVMVVLFFGTLVRHRRQLKVR